MPRKKKEIKLSPWSWVEDEYYSSRHAVNSPVKAEVLIRNDGQWRWWVGDEEDPYSKPFSGVESTKRKAKIAATKQLKKCLAEGVLL